MQFRTLHIIFFLYLSVALHGQVILNNPGFEDTPQDATTPQGWLACEPGTTPDILPGFGGVNLLPVEGQSFVGLITRKDGSFESIGQQLYPTLTKNKCHEFYIHLAKSRRYVGYSKAIQVRIWLADERCEKSQLVYTSPVIKHKKWKRYHVEFTPEQDASYILIEVFTEDQGKKGHVLIDGISSIQRCSKA